MKAMVLALTASVSESAIGQLWRAAGMILEIVIPIALFTTIMATAGAIILGFAR